MLRKYYKLCNNSNYTHFLRACLSSSPVSHEKWDLLTAVCIERKPVIVPQMTEMESKFKNLLAELESEKSLKSDFELQHENELKQIELLKKGDIDSDTQLKQTAQDFADACNEELAKFKPASKITEADKKNDLKSLNRKLDRHLVLVVNQTIGKDKLYLLPQGVRQDGETLRQAAERVLKEKCGGEIKAQIYSNAPASFYKYKYPKAIRGADSPVGAKVFIYFARYLNGKLPDKGVEYKWLDRAELDKSLPQKYKNSVLDMLIDE